MKKIMLIVAIVMLSLVGLNIYRISLVDNVTANTSSSSSLVNTSNSTKSEENISTSTSSSTSSTRIETLNYLNPIDKTTCEEYTFIRGFTSLHDGIDLSSGKDTCKILSVTSGLVTQSGWVNGGGGWQVTVKTSQNTEVIYSHLAASGLFVTEGQKISEGTPVGIMGMSGRATGRHLHLTIKENGKEVDPLKYINIK